MRRWVLPLIVLTLPGCRSLLGIEEAATFDAPDLSDAAVDAAVDAAFVAAIDVQNCFGSFVQTQVAAAAVVAVAAPARSSRRIRHRRPAAFGHRP